jgi:antirestriction protein ArdC
MPAAIWEKGIPIMSDIYQTITDRIVAQIEQGAGAWRMPWHTKHGATEMQLPRNVVSGRAYRGVNVPMLWGAAQAFGYESPFWATYKQWSERSCQVRKGEKATMVVFWRTYKVDRDDSGDDEGDDKRLVVRAYFVFNAAQVDGFSVETVTKGETPEDLSEDQRIASADAFFAATGSTVRHGGNRAFYTTGGDFIQMPEFGQFDEPVSYYSTLAHEHTHWSGHKARLDRQFGARFGDQAYAFEELVAELGAAYLCGVLGLANEPRADHAAYLDSWLKVLKGDKKAIFTAASRSQAAVDYLQSLQASETRLAA